MTSEEELKETDGYKAWQIRAREDLPNLAARVFALRGQPYAGHGFHYHMEMQLGGVIRLLNEPGGGPFIPHRAERIARREAARVSVEMLYESVAEAERYLGTKPKVVCKNCDEPSVAFGMCASCHHEAEVGR